MKLLEFDKQLLSTAGLVYDEDGFVSRKEGNQSVPVTIKDQRLVLATDAQLENSDWQHRVVFNPMYEGLARKESPVHEAFRLMINVRLNTIFGVLLAKLLDISGNTDLHPHLSPEQTEFLDVIKRVKPTDTMKNYVKILEAFPGDRAFVNIYSKPGGLVGDVKYARAAIVSFPIYEALAKAEDKVITTPAGKVTLSTKKDIETFKLAIEYIIPKINDKHFYDVGSTSKMAPLMESLLKAAAGIFVPLDHQVRLFADRIEDAELLMTPLDWANEIDTNITGLYNEARRRGMMNGNEGDPLNAPPPPAAPAQQQAAQAAPAVKREVLINPITGKPMDMRPQEVKPSPFPTPNVAPQQHQFQPPPQQFSGHGQPFNSFQAQAPAAPAIRPNGKADLMAAINGNPALAVATSGVALGGVAPQMQNQGRTPGWAQGGGQGFVQQSGFAPVGGGTPRRGF